MAQDHGLCRKKKSKWTGARAATAGPCCSCQRDSPRSLQTCWVTNGDPGAHGHETGGKQSKVNRTGLSKTERGQELMRAVGMAGKEWQAHSPLNKHCRRTQPADSPPGTGLKTNERPTVGRPCSKNNSCRRCWPASCRAVQVEGESAMVPAPRKAGSDLPNPISTPPIAFACHCPYPLP